MSMALGFASKWCIRLDALSGDNIKEIIKWSSGAGQMSKILIATCMWYSIWHLRNELQFQGKLDLKAAVLKFESSVEEFGYVSKGVSQLSSGKVPILWRPPCPGRLTINADASVGGGRCAWAMVVSNHVGKMVLFASWWGEESSPQLAESKALVWAARIAMDHGWLYVDWKSDAQVVIKQMVDGTDLCGWETRNELLFLQQLRINLKGWSYA